MTENIIDVDYRYDIFDKEGCMIPEGDGFVCLDSAIEYALKNGGCIIIKIYLPLDEDGEIIEDAEVISEEIVWRKF